MKEYDNVQEEKEADRGRESWPIDQASKEGWNLPD